MFESFWAVRNTNCKAERWVCMKFLFWLQRVNGWLSRKQRLSSTKGITSVSEYFNLSFLVRDSWDQIRGSGLILFYAV